MELSRLSVVEAAASAIRTTLESLMPMLLPTGEGESTPAGEPSQSSVNTNTTEAVSGGYTDATPFAETAASDTGTDTSGETPVSYNILDNTDAGYTIDQLYAAPEMPIDNSRKYSEEDMARIMDAANLVEEAFRDQEQ